MASPRVFISSTCYDLGQIRDSLAEFIEGYCFEPMLSEKGDVFFHPDMHTHESCINEIENCQLFILIIGGRFGGNYKYDKTKSITNAEYEAAKIKKIPVFTFIKRDLFEDHRLYQKNKHNEALIKQIEFPSVDNQEYAVNIFEFINQVRLSDVNNGFLPFEFVKDIKQYLGKQWAGMMFDFLNERNRNNDQKLFKNTLDNLTLLNKKTEELIEGIVKKLSPSDGTKQIAELNKIIAASMFYKHILSMFRVSKYLQPIEQIAKIKPGGKTWFEYVAKMAGFKISTITKEGDKITKYKTVKTLDYVNNHRWSVVTEDNELPQDVIIAENLFEYVKPLTEAEINKAIGFIAIPENTVQRKPLIKKSK